MRGYIFIFLSIISFALSEDLYSFSALGDFGGAALEGQYTKNVYAVANQFTNSSKLLHPKFIINTGDNIYWCGVT
jgi:hypothetical protein